MDNKIYFSYILTLITSVLYIVFAYNTSRTNFEQVFILYTLLFICFSALIYLNRSSFRFLTFISLFFRLLFLFAIPNLSNDFYRFIWDGRMLFEGYNPFLYLPKDLIVTQPNIIAQSQELYKGMGEMNGSHYTCYPTLNQITFLIPAFFSSTNIMGSVITMRTLIILADIGTFFFGKQLLEKLKLPRYTIFYYILNPFIIIELTGNLHFEGVMIFFLSAALFYIFTKKYMVSALMLTFSISVKLVPLLFLPLFFKKIPFKTLILFYLVVGTGTTLLFLPFLSLDFIQNFMSSIHLYFQNFEFNASIYYLIREIGYATKGYNIIGTVGKIIPIIVLIIILLLALIRKNITTNELILSMLFGISIYYSLSTTVHPWYIAVPLFLSLFTPYRFPIVWSFVLILSYSAYQDVSYHENLALVAVEYCIVYSFFFYELFFIQKKK